MRSLEKPLMLFPLGVSFAHFFLVCNRETDDSHVLEDATRQGSGE
jgi:hypothetical protein